MDHLPMHIGQTEIPSCILKSESFVIETQLMEQCGVQVVHMDPPLNALESELICFAVRITGLESTAC